MSKQFRYRFEPRSQKHNCPDCQKKTFVRYVDSETGELLPEQYGRCDRECNCGYHLNPYRDGYARQNLTPGTKGYPINGKKRAFQGLSVQKPTLPYPIPSEVLKSTLLGYNDNSFIQSLSSRITYPFEPTDITSIISLYNLGTITKGYRAGAVTLPFIDHSGFIRAIQVKQFDENCHTTGTDQIQSVLARYPFIEAGKSVFDPVTGKRRELLPDWLIKYSQNESKFTCLFGEHLLSKFPLNTIALVEAPKTAVIATLYLGFPMNPENLLWLAVGSLSYLNTERCKVLQGRDVILFPDLSKNGTAFLKWKNKANEMTEQMPGTRFSVSELLEQIASNQQRESGLDLADFLITQDWRKFRYLSQSETTPQTRMNEKGEKSEPQNKTNTGELIVPEPVTPQNFEPLNQLKDTEPILDWQLEISDLETFFAGTILPHYPVQLTPHEKITNLPRFIESHLATVKANNGKPTFLPYLNRLILLKTILSLILNSDENTGTNSNQRFEKHPEGDHSKGNSAAA